MSTDKIGRELGPLIVSADDGTLLRASVEKVGNSAQRRWIIRRPNGVVHVGPPLMLERSVEDVAALIRDWYRTKKALGQIDSY